MAYDGVHPLFPYTNEDRLEIRRELGLKESTIEEDVDVIVDWFYKQPHLVDAGIDRDFIERMLIMAKGSLEKTKHRIDNYYKHRYLAPELIQNREKLLSNAKDLWEAYIQLSVPKLYKGNRVSVFRYISPDPSLVNCEEWLTVCFMLGDIRMKFDYCLGDIWIVDMKLISFGHLLKMNPVSMQKAAHLFHDGLGMRITAIHVVNATNLLQHIINFLKPFFSQKVLDRVIVHASLEDLHKHVPKKYLPKDYGGEEPDSHAFKDKIEKELRSTRTKQFLIDASKMVSDEKKRPNADINEEYLAGSFRKLEVD